MTDPCHYFGIRHHGPGCARSLLRALKKLEPDCLLVEGPAGCEALLEYLLDPEFEAPVALLSHAIEDPHLATFHPYAEFSPEWQAMRWAKKQGVPIQFIDLPPGVNLSWQKQDRATCTPHAQDAAEASEMESPDEVRIEVVDETAPVEGEENDGPAHDVPHDPLDWLAQAAGFGDGETWWNHQVEERGDGEGLFEAIAEAMVEVRTQVPVRPSTDHQREEIREAHMRQALRQARKQGHARIAIVCGAWHVPALMDAGSAAADQRLLKGLDKLKSQSTWIPWTYRHLSAASGYRAGVHSPGWYDYLWRSEGDRSRRAIGWYARVARLLREHDIDCSSAHLIEAARLADTLAALRDRPAPGLDELNEATRSVIGAGDDAPMRLIAERLMIGERIGSVPTSVPVIPLQRDLEATQKRLRLKPEALSRDIDLDLRRDIDLQRSHLLHRLKLLDIGWGELARSGHSTRGTFHEIWKLAWQPEFQIELIMAGRHGQTIASAATSRVIESAREAKTLTALSALIDRVLLADLADAVPLIAAELEARTATESDPLALLAALPALANTYRYGNVRKTDSSQVAHLFDRMLLRGSVGLPLALCDLDETPAESAREIILAADRALELRQSVELIDTWRSALRAAALSDVTTPLLRGMSVRLLLDAAAISTDEVSGQLQLNLSQGAEPLAAAQWLDGFLNRNATVLLHGDAMWRLVDAWMSALGDAHFAQIVPLLRRTFSAFEAADRRDLGERAKRNPDEQKVAINVSAPWNVERAMRAIPALRELLGIDDGQ